MTHPIAINALVLRAMPGRGNLWRLDCFSRQMGRIAVSTIAKRSAGFSPFCLVEASLIFRGQEYAVAHDIEVIDTFASIRNNPGAAKSAFVLRAILERCLPIHAPAEETWFLVLSLFDMISACRDWRAAPLVLALTFLEHEGIAPQTISTLPTLTDETQRTAHTLMTSGAESWKTATIPHEWFYAVLEAIGVENVGMDAKGVT